MLSESDEPMCHQLPFTMDQVHTDNPEREGDGQAVVRRRTLQ
jgi:hypothetical protein